MNRPCVFRSFALILFLSLTLSLDTYAQSSSAHNSKRNSRPVAKTEPAVADHAKYYFLCSAPYSKHEDDLKVTSMVISLADQRLYAYSGDLLIGWSNCSTGKAGHETPEGTFKITQKHIDHYSNKYNNAPMPYFMRLTDDGVGLHAGFLPGYAASHGCIRPRWAWSGSFIVTPLPVRRSASLPGRPIPITTRC